MSMTKDEQEILAQRIAGRNEHAIARDRGISVAEVKQVIRKYADETLDDETRRNHLALELGRIDQLQQRYYLEAMQGNLTAAQFVARLIERRCVILGLHTPQLHTLQIIDSTQAARHTTNRLEAALTALIEDRSSQNSKPN